MAARRIDPALVAEQRLADRLQALDFATVRAAAAERTVTASRGSTCRWCAGRFGPVIDTTELVRGRSFLAVHGLRGPDLVLKQVSSTRHRDDLDSVPPMDAIALFEALARAEAFLASSGDPAWPEVAPGRRGHVAICKRRNARTHGTQTITLHRDPPAWLVRERQFVARHGVGRASFLETRNPAELLVGEFRGGLVAAVPAAPLRAFETVIWCRPGATGSLADLSGNQRWGLAQAVREITGALRLELAVRGLPEVYGWRLVAGPGIEPYVRIVTPRSTVARDGPAEWVDRLRRHIGVE
jgi:hypothetical protein